MPKFLKARVKETTTTTGTGTLQLLGAVTGYQTFLDAFGNGNRCFYMATDGTAWEYGLGTINSSSQLARTLIIDSSDSGGPITFAAGTKQVYCAMTPWNCVSNGTTTLTNGTTLSVSGLYVILFDYASPATITSFSNGIDGQEILLVNIGSSTVTIQANANQKLSGGVSFSCTTSDTMRLVQYNGNWYELTRSTNT